jgi:aldehyde dehydrogenase (NAD+)
MTDTAQSESPTTAFDAAGLVAEVRRGFDERITHPIEWRRAQLDALTQMLRDHTDRFTEALRSDLGKSEIEAWTTEIGFSINDIEYQRDHLADWAAPRKVKTPLMFRPGHSKIVPQPKGVALIIAPWNYPLQLMIAPMAAAISAGNAVVAKPSELSPAVSEALVELCATYLDQRVVRVVGGGVDESTALLEQRFDHIFFTGGTRVGKIVMRAAAEHLTPVTLELGGKSPAIVAADANIGVAARRLVWGKFTNAGQTCIAPDYLLVERSVRDRLVDEITKVIGEFYGDDPQVSADYGRIVNAGHHDRLSQLLADSRSGRTHTGGTVDAADRYIAPTVLVDPDPDAPVMQEEIFGPLLPVIAVDSIDDAITFVNERPKPLALYVFSDDDDTVDDVLNRTTSGGAGVNNTLMHIAPPDLPFGGVGPSGMGAYHGQAGFDTFSPLRSVYDRSVRPDPSLIYPPFSGLKERLIKRFT